MVEKHPNKHRCPVIEALNMIGGKWKIPVLWNLFHSDLRYNELKRRLPGITNIMLTRCLRDLEEGGLVNRIQFAEIPPHVEYSLTKSSRELGNVLSGINEWGEHMHALQNDALPPMNTKIR